MIRFAAAALLLSFAGPGQAGDGGVRLLARLHRSVPKVLTRYEDARNAFERAAARGDL